MREYTISQAQVEAISALIRDLGGSELDYGKLIAILSIESKGRPRNDRPWMTQEEAMLCVEKGHYCEP